MYIFAADSERKQAKQRAGCRVLRLHALLGAPGEPAAALFHSGDPEHQFEGVATRRGRSGSDGGSSGRRQHLPLRATLASRPLVLPCAAGTNPGTSLQTSSNLRSMPLYSCCTCAAQFAEAAAPPVACPICTDDRQYVAPGGQVWATREELRERHRNTLKEVEPGVLAIGVEPKLAIGQQVGATWVPAVPGGQRCYVRVVPPLLAVGAVELQSCPQCRKACHNCTFLTPAPGLPHPSARWQRAVGLPGRVPPRHRGQHPGGGRHLSHRHQPSPLLLCLCRLGRGLWLQGRGVSSCQLAFCSCLRAADFPSLAAAASNCHLHLHRPQVYLHAADRQWVTRPSPRLEFWEGDERQLGPGLRLMHLGGHFPGSCVLLWEAARDGKGAMFTGEGWIGVERKAPGAQRCQGHSNRPG